VQEDIGQPTVMALLVELSLPDITKYQRQQPQVSSLVMEEVHILVKLACAVCSMSPLTLADGFLMNYNYMLTITIA
jgi:hypothetical protein